MSQYYNAPRTRNLYVPDSPKPFKLSRSKIDLFIECPRCFYLDRKLGIGRPPGYPFNLNSAVDHLLKQEFDIRRANGEKHPLMEQYGIDAIPAPHDSLEKWRDFRSGIKYHDQSTNFLVYGAIDDLWITPEKEYIIVDYKATSKNARITHIDEPWQIGYKRQMEVYQWLFRQNGYDVSDTGYFIYCNGITDKEAFDARLEFEITVISYRGSADWVDKTLKQIYECLNRKDIPAADEDCDYCTYRKAAWNVSKI